MTSREQSASPGLVRLVGAGLAALGVYVLAEAADTRDAPTWAWSTSDVVVPGLLGILLLILGARLFLTPTKVRSFSPPFLAALAVTATTIGAAAVAYAFGTGDLTIARLALFPLVLGSWAFNAWRSRRRHSTEARKETAG